MLTNKGKYGLKAMVHLAGMPAGQPALVADIAAANAIPKKFLDAILGELRTAGFVHSKKGRGGGYVLARVPEQITLGQIVSAVDGPIMAGDFGQPHENGACDHEGQCVLLAVWSEVGEHMRHHLDSFTLADMVERARGGLVPLGPLD